MGASGRRRRIDVSKHRMVCGDKPQTHSLDAEEVGPPALFGIHGVALFEIVIPILKATYHEYADEDGRKVDIDGFDVGVDRTDADAV